MDKPTRKEVYEKAEKYAKENLKKIVVVSGGYNSPKMCHHVACDKAYTEDKWIVVTLSFVPNSGVNVHFINRNRTDERYVDHTLGYLSSFNDYYLVGKFDYKGRITSPTSAKTILMKTKRDIMKKLGYEGLSDEDINAVI